LTPTGDVRFMQRALSLARRGIGETNPNPMVGCVIVRQGEIVGEGYHRRAGGPHAEVEALRRAGSAARGGTLYVNLEPCAHHGRTPPCAPQVAAAGVRRVVVASADPNPRVKGRGIAFLRRQGLSVSLGVLEAEAARLNERFLTAMRQRRPFVLLKAGMTLDGRIATSHGESQWITSVSQRASAHRLRRLFDGILVGIGTVLADDPLLLPVPGVARPYVRIVLDSRYRTPLNGRLAQSLGQGPVLIVGGRGRMRRRRALAAAGFTILSAPTSSRPPVEWVLSQLWQRGLVSIFVEGGGEVLGELLASGCVDQVALFRAPLLLGGKGSRSAFAGPDPARLDQALRLVRGRYPAGFRPNDDPTAPALEVWVPAPGRPRASLS
jgi:diaminohydroxyphosphoribosylaminopyrimidine deaminase/5-amino-6-(5-phosphoribosylamino)uracil reductase